MSSRFVPKSEFNSIPEAKFVVDDAKVVFHDILSRADGFCYLAVLESLGDELDNSEFSFVGSPVTVALSFKHNCPPIETARGLRCRIEERKTNQTYLRAV